MWTDNIEKLLYKKIDDCQEYYEYYKKSAYFYDRIIKVIDIGAIILTLTSIVMATLAKYYDLKIYNILNIVLNAVVSAIITYKTAYQYDKKREKTIGIMEKFIILINVIETELAKDKDNRRDANTFINNITKQFNNLIINKLNLINISEQKKKQYEQLKNSDVKMTKEEEYQLGRYIDNIV